MINAFLLLLLLIVWIHLHQKISRSLSQTETLLKEMAGLKELLSHRTVEEGHPAGSLVPPPPPPISEARPEAASAACAAQALTPPASVCPPPPPRLPNPRPAVAPRRAVNYEKYIGENLFGKIGILILVVGMGLFVKYAIDNDWINETLRTILGFAVGGVLLLLAFRLKNPYRMFSSLLAGGAFAIFYVTIAIAYHYYELFSQPVA